MSFAELYGGIDDALAKGVSAFEALPDKSDVGHRHDASEIDNLPEPTEPVSDEHIRAIADEQIALIPEPEPFVLPAHRHDVSDIDNLPAPTEPVSDEHIRDIADEQIALLPDPPAPVTDAHIRQLADEQIALQPAPTSGITKIVAGTGISVSGAGTTASPMVITNTAPESSGPAGIVTSPGVVQIDSFSGATDGDKFQAFLTYYGQQTNGPVGQLPARNFNTGNRSFVVPQGMRLMGSGMIPGPKNLEQGERNVSGKWTTSCGVDAASLFTISGNVFGVTLAGIAFQGGLTSQLMYSGTGGNMYSAELNSLAIYGFKHILGSTGTKFLNTYMHLTGVWTAVALGGTGFHLGGSDSWLFKNGAINLGAHQATDGGGAYLFELNGQSKSFVGGIYATADQNYRALRVRGNNSNDVSIDGGVYEGYKDNDPSLGNLIRIEGGSVTIRDARLAYGMRTPLSSEHGLIEVTGGRVMLEGIKYDMGSTPETVPVVYQSGGFVQIRSMMNLGSTNQPLVRRVAGTMEVDSTVTIG